LLTLFFETIRVLAKGIKQITYKIILLFIKIYIFRAANKTFSKCYKAKKARVRQGGIFTIEDTQDIII
jgi:hypothetical protein